MRIAHVIDYFHTDVGYQEYYLAKAQSQAGHKVRVITSALRHHNVRRPGPDEESGRLALEASGVEVRRLGARQLGHDRAWLRGLARELRAFAPDAVHCHGPFAPTTVRTALTCRRLGCRLLVDNHMQRHIAPGASTPAGWAAYTVYRATAGPVLRRSVDDWVAIGPLERDFLCRRLGLGTDRVTLIPLGFDEQRFDFDPQRREAVRSQRGWGDDLVVAATGKLHAGKRVDAVAGACEARGRTQPVRLVIAGDIPAEHLAAVRAAAPDLDAAGRIDVHPMLGWQDLADLYRAADVVVFARLPSISIYEAAGTGAHVLVGDDEFARWLASMHPGIEAVAPYMLAERLEPAADRPLLAEQARQAFSWPVLSEAFVRRYQGRT